MVSVRTGILLILLLAFSAGALPPAEQKSIEHAFQKKQEETSTLQSGFRQTVRMAGVRDPVVSTGKFYYLAPQSILIRFDQPKGEYMMMKGNELFIKKAGKKETRRKLKADEPHTGLSMLLDLFRTGGRQFQDEFELRMRNEAGDLLVTLTQKKSDDDLLPLKIENRLSRADLSLKSVLVQFEGGQAILYEFIKPVRNKTIAPSIFENQESL